MDIDFTLDGQVIHITCKSPEEAQRVMKYIYFTFTRPGIGEPMGIVGLDADGNEVRTGVFENDLPN